jgi:hypothetical protein
MPPTLRLLLATLALSLAQKGDVRNEAAEAAAQWANMDWAPLEADLWAKVRSSRGQLREAAFLEWGTRGLNATDMMALTHGSIVCLKLEHLYLPRNHLQSAGVAVLAAAALRGMFPALTRLDLFATDAEATGASVLSRAASHGAFAKLQMLDLGNDALGDNGVAELAAAVSTVIVTVRGTAGTHTFHDLRSLFLVRNQITAVGARSLAEAIGREGVLPQLAYLDLSGNQLGDEGAAALAQALIGGALPHLLTLDARENNLTDSGRAQLATACGRSDPTHPRVHPYL